ncbi:MAG: penicillin-insensitive murein endopeptidase, partial [Myxococcota bacterium]|nr:penicillin-insensitive murein endopeptidase [Myxococcota bacterium]
TEPLGADAIAEVTVAAVEPAVLAVESAPGIDPLTVPGSLSTSLGGPAHGTIRGALALPERSPGLRSNERRPNPTAYYGTVELVRALVRAAAVVEEELPGSEVVINDIGLPEGGPIPHHGSHQAGRDVDVLFYYLDRDDQPWPAKGVPLDPRGRGWDFGDLSDPRDDVRVRLDAPRTWRFVQALLEDDLAGEGALFQRIFLVEHVRTLLLAEAERVRAPRAVRDRFELLTCQPGHPHDDHLHFRTFCTDEDLQDGCADGPPMYPWRRQQLREAEIDPVRATRAPRTRRARTVTRGEARASAGPMHSRVRAFLEERAEWSVLPHPGRPFCR